MLRITQRVKALIGVLVVCLPATLFFGPFALLGAAGWADIFAVWTDSHIWQKEVTHLDYYPALQGLGGLLGLLGLWLGSIFRSSLARKITFLSWVVVGLLLFGSVAAVWVVLDLAPFALEDREPLGLLWLTLIVAYALFLVKVILKPNKLLNADAHKQRAG